MLPVAAKVSWMQILRLWITEICQLSAEQRQNWKQLSRAVKYPENACLVLGMVYEWMVNECLLCLYIETIIGRGLPQNSG